MRVAIVTENYLPKMDGIVRVICLLLDHFEANGIDAVVVAPRFPSATQTYGQTEFIGTPGVANPFYSHNLKMGFPTVSTYRQLKTYKPDIVHFFHPVSLGLPAFLLAKQLNIPTVISFHLDYANLSKHFGIGFLRRPINLLTRIVMNSADCRLAPSKLVQQRLKQMGIHDVDLWGRGVDAEQFHPRFFSQEMRTIMSDNHPDEILLLYVGRLSSEKRICNLRSILAEIPGTRLVILGDGPERTQLEEQFAGTNTKFMGHIEGDQLAQAYASADIFVFPSALESFGLVLLEAMASGLPVVSSRVGGAMDVIREGWNGYTFDVDDTQHMIDVVKKTIENHHRMGENAREYAESQSWDVYMDELIQIYQQVISDHDS